MMVSGKQSAEEHIEYIFQAVIKPAIASVFDQSMSIRGPVHVLVMSTDEEFSEDEPLPILFESLSGSSGDWKNWKDSTFKGVAYVAARLSWLTGKSMREVTTLHDGALYKKILKDIDCSSCGSCHHEGLLVVVNGIYPYEWNHILATMFAHAIDPQYR